MLKLINFKMLVKTLVGAISILHLAPYRKLSAASKTIPAPLSSLERFLSSEPAPSLADKGTRPL